jgi:hypothetical protein
LSVCCALSAGCGSAALNKPVADRVCDGAHGAAARLGFALSARIADREPANLECVLKARQLRVDVISQAGARAYTEFDTTTSHQDQVYGAGRFNQRGQVPITVSVPGSVAVWIPAQGEIVATNATPTTGGSYVTVRVSGRSVRGHKALVLAQAVARATFAAHPDPMS